MKNKFFILLSLGILIFNAPLIFAEGEVPIGTIGPVYYTQAPTSIEIPVNWYNQPALLNGHCYKNNNQGYYNASSLTKAAK